MHLKYNMHIFTFPPISAHNIISSLCENVLQLTDQTASGTFDVHCLTTELKKQLVDYTCSLIRLGTREINKDAQSSAELTNILLWYEEWRILRGNFIADMGAMRRMPPEGYVAAYLCIALKLCFGLAERENEETSMIWKDMIKTMLRKFNKRHHQLLNNTNGSTKEDPPTSLANVTVDEFLYVIGGNQDMTSANFDEEKHPFLCDLESKKHHRIRGLYREMRSALLEQNTSSFPEQPSSWWTDTTEIPTPYIPAVPETEVQKHAQQYVQYNTGHSNSHIKNRRHGRIHDGQKREHIQISYMIECFAEYLDVSYKEMYMCMIQIERSLI